MYKIKFISKFVIRLELYADCPVEVFVDTLTFDPKPRKGIRILILEEPLRDLNLIQYVRRYPVLYDYVFTFQHDLLRSNPKAVHFRCAELWVSRGYLPEFKRFAVSTVVGGKNDLRMPGYELRHEVWRNQSEITMPKEFYLSDSYKWTEIDYEKHKDRVLLGSKDKLFDVMFHIAIENCSIRNYYSEKLLDCIESMTVPVYFGCLNLGDYFDTRGIVQVHNIGDIVSACNRMTRETYDEMKPYMEENRRRIAGLKNYDGQLEDKLREVLGKHIINKDE